MTNEVRNWLRQTTVSRRTAWLRMAIRKVTRYRHVAFGAGALVDGGSTFGTHVQIGPYTSVGSTHIGSFSYVAMGSILGHCEIGAFTSIGPNVVVGVGRHPTQFVSTHPVTFSNAYRPRPFATADFDETPSTKVGNDVWIGATAVLVPGVSIGDGAVVGAGAVVTHDVPPYAIVLGVPARLVGYRHDEETRAMLLASKWWEWSEVKLRSMGALFLDAEQFCKRA